MLYELKRGRDVSKLLYIHSTYVHCSSSDILRNEL